MEKILFEQMGGTYTRQGDYLLPDLSLAPQEDCPIGIWGQRRKRYLKEHHRVLYYNLLTQGKPNSHLADVEEQAQSMFERLTEQMAEKQGITEALKTTDMIAWVGRMNNICNQAQKIINHELIYVSFKFQAAVYLIGLLLLILTIKNQPSEKAADS